ncbi:polyadenylate-binding protein 2, partial [Striga asiatica]
MTWILASTVRLSKSTRFGKLSRAYSPRSLNSELAVFVGASSEGPKQLFQFEDDLRTREFDGGRGRRSPQNANRKEVDPQSVFVGNVEYGQPKRYAYVEFVMPPSTNKLGDEVMRLMILILPKEGLPDLDPP